MASVNVTAGGGHFGRAPLAEIGRFIQKELERAGVEGSFKCRLTQEGKVKGSTFKHGISHLKVQHGGIIMDVQYDDSNSCWRVILVTNEAEEIAEKLSKLSESQQESEDIVELAKKLKALSLKRDDHKHKLSMAFAELREVEERRNLLIEKKEQLKHESANLTEELAAVKNKLFELLEQM